MSIGKSDPCFLFPLHYAVPYVYFDNFESASNLPVNPNSFNHGTSGEVMPFLIGRLQKIHGMAIPGLGFHYQTYMDIESLVDRGLIAEDSGQIRLNLV